MRTTVAFLVLARACHLRSIAIILRFDASLRSLGVFSFGIPIRHETLQSRDEGNRPRCVTSLCSAASSEGRLQSRHPLRKR